MLNFLRSSGVRMDPLIPALFTCKFEIIAMSELPKRTRSHQLINDFRLSIQPNYKRVGRRKNTRRFIFVQNYTNWSLQEKLFIYFYIKKPDDPCTNQPIQACMFLNSKPIYDSSEILEILCNIIRSKAKIYPLKENTWNPSKDVCISCITNMSSFPKWVLMKSAKEEMVVGSITSS